MSITRINIPPLDAIKGANTTEQAEGYRLGFNGQPLPDTQPSRATIHGWRWGRIFSGRAPEPYLFVGDQFTSGG